MNKAVHPDAMPFQAQAGVSRRTFVSASLAAGFALAVRPAIADSVIHTDDKGLIAGNVTIPVGDTDMPAYRAMPNGAGPYPTVLVVQEIFGVHEHIRDICRRLAHLGYFAVAPELYVRQGDVSKIENIDNIIKQVVAKVPDAQVMSDLDHTVAWAKATGKAKTDSLGMTGFCWGGRIVWLYAEHNPALKAGVAWYGRLTGDTNTLTPFNPIDKVTELKAPVLGLYGGADAGISAESIEQMRTAIKKAGKVADIVVYPDTPHGFNADYRPSYRPEAANDGWKRMQAWFKEHGVV